MVPIRFDSLGRRIPDIDYSARSKKAAKTQKEKYGEDHHKKIGSIGGQHHGRGYFGKLKEENPQKFKEEIAKANTARKEQAAGQLPKRPGVSTTKAIKGKRKRSIS